MKRKTEWQQWMEAQQCHENVVRFCGAHVVEALDRDGTIVEPEPDRKVIVDAVDFQTYHEKNYTPGRHKWRVDRYLRSIRRWRGLAADYLRTRNQGESFDGWLSRNVDSAED